MKRWIHGAWLAAAFASAMAIPIAAHGQREQDPTKDPSRLDEWLVNPHGEVDGALLHDGHTIFFSPEVGRTVTLSFHLGDPLAVELLRNRQYLLNARDNSRIEITNVSVGGGPPSRSGLQHMVARGLVSALMELQEGAVFGLVLDTGEQVRIDPKLGLRLEGLRLGQVVTIEGLGSHGRWGTGMLATTVRDGNGRVLASE